MALQKRFSDPRKQFVDPYWTIISGVLSHGRGRSKLTLDRRECVEIESAQPASPKSRLLKQSSMMTGATPVCYRLSTIQWEAPLGLHRPACNRVKGRHNGREPCGISAWLQNRTKLADNASSKRSTQPRSYFRSCCAVMWSVHKRVIGYPR